MSCSTPSISPRRLISTATEPPVGVAAHQVDRADGGRELAPYQAQAVGQGGGVLGEQLLEVLLDAVLLQAGVHAEVVAGVVQHLLDQDPQAVTGLGGHGPLDLAVLGGALADGARRAHPVQRLVGAAVGVHQHRAVGLEHQHPGGHRQVGAQPSGVVDLAAGHDESHERRIYLPCWRAWGGASESHGRRGRGHRADLCRPAGRGGPPGGRPRPGLAAGDDLGGRGCALVPLQGAAPGPGHAPGRATSYAAFAELAPTDKDAGVRMTAGHRGAPRADRGPLVGGRRARPGARRAAAGVRRRLVASPRRSSTCRSTCAGCGPARRSSAAR